MKDRLLAFLMAFTMLISVFSVSAFAEEEILADVVMDESAEAVGESFEPEETVTEETTGETTEFPGEETEIAISAVSGEDEESDCVFVDASSQILSFGGFFPRPTRLLRATSADYAGAAEKLAEGMKKYAESVDISTFKIPRDDARKVFSQAMNSHPELYFVNGSFRYTYGTTTNNLKIIYLEYLEDYSHTEEVYEAAVQKALSYVKDGMTDVQKALVLHDYLDVHVAYDNGRSHYNSYDALVTGCSVCQGYSLAYVDLLQRCGVACSIATSDSMNHAWNLVKIGQEWYHVDLTWDDPVNPSYQNTPGQVRHMYFFASDKKMRDSLEHYDWVSDYTCTSTLYDAGAFWTDCNSRIVMPDAQKAYYLLSEKNGGNVYSVKLYGRDMNDNTVNVLSTWNTTWSAGESGYWLGTYSYLSYDKDRFWLNDADKIYVWTNGESKCVYTAPKGSQIYGLFVEDGTATIALSDTPNEYAKIINQKLSFSENYVVTYDLNGGTGEIEPQIKNENEPLTLSEKIPTRKGYTFLGWAANAEATEAQYRPGDDYKEDANVTLFAVWSVKSDVTGDVTDDDDVTIADVVKLNQVVLGKVTLTDKEKQLGDVNYDGDITIADVVRVNQYVLKKISNFDPT